MSDSKYIRHDFKRSLAHLVEECGETLAAAGKTLRWGPRSFNPELMPADRETNIAWLEREMNDLREAMDRLQKCINEGRFS